MKNKVSTIFSILGIILFVLIFNSCSNKPVDVTDQIKKANEEFATAVSKSDTGALIALYTSDAKIYPSNSAIIDGQASIGKFWAATLNAGIKNVQFETVTAQKFGDIAIEEGNFKLSIEGGHVVGAGKYIVTWKNENGKWKVYRDIWNENTPALTRAKEKDSVLIVLNPVKADKVTQFEDFIKNCLVPAGNDFNPNVKATVRFEKPVAPNKDGIFTYIFIMDPYVGKYNYDIFYTLKGKFGEEKAKEYFNKYIDCLKDGKQQAYFAVQSEW